MVGLKRVVVFPIALDDVRGFRFYENKATVIPVILMSMPILSLMQNPRSELMRKVFNPIVPKTGQNIVGGMLASTVAKIQDQLIWKD